MPFLYIHSQQKSQSVSSDGSAEAQMKSPREAKGTVRAMCVLLRFRSWGPAPGGCVWLGSTLPAVWGVSQLLPGQQGLQLCLLPGQGTEKNTIFLASSRQHEISRNNHVFLGQNLFFFSLSPIIWIPIVTPSIWTSLWIFWVFFPPVLYVFFVSTTNTNLKNILFSLRLPHWSPVFSWSQQCVQNKHCLCCRWNVLISPPQALMEAGKVYCIKSH